MIFNIYWMAFTQHVPQQRTDVAYYSGRYFGALLIYEANLKSCRTPTIYNARRGSLARMANLRLMRSIVPWFIPFYYYLKDIAVSVCLYLSNLR